MKLLQSFIPLNIFHIQASPCCDFMFSEYTHNKFSRNFLCYDACSIFEANILVIWGSLSQKLINHVNNIINYTPKHRFILHIQGCNNRLDYELSISSLKSFIPVNLVIADCQLNQLIIKQIITEARQCLKA